MSASELARWIVRWQPPAEPPAVRLLCFPYAGGGASIFRGWPASLPAGVEVCAVQLPGRESRFLEETYGELTLLVRELAETLAPLLDVRFALFGHSLGGLLAFELARELRRAVLPEPAHLFVSGHGAPHLPEDGRAIHALPTPDFLAALRRFGGTPSAVLEHEELLELVLPALRADFALCERYRYRAEEPLDVPLTVFYGDEDQAVDEVEAAAWRSQTEGEFALRRLPGDHFFLRAAEAELLGAIAAALAPLLDRALTEPATARGVR